MEKDKKYFKPRSNNYEARVRAGFAAQKVMKTIGCELVTVKPGSVELTLKYLPEMTQQNGFLHAGIISTALDTACGAAAASLAADGTNVLAVEFKANFLSPAKGEKFRIIADVLKAGRTINVCQASAYAIDNLGEKLVTQMTGTIMVVPSNS